MPASRFTSPFALYARAFREARPYWPHLALILALGLGWMPVALLMPLPVKIVVDSVLGGQALPWPLDRVAGMTGGADGALYLAIGLSVLIAGYHSCCGNGWRSAWCSISAAGCCCMPWDCR
jgi:ATP-binding cassette subfamily B protein